ncbi:MAG: hypothetical protein VX000_11010 [Myxococcota bacterium]|nr:hypothetical protein [Myxococcota bacterium]
MEWEHAGQDGGAFRDRAEATPGWYWVCRPQNIGERAYDPDKPVVLPIYVRPDGTVQSPLSDLESLDADALACQDEEAGVTWGTYFAGPIGPGPLEGTLEAGKGYPPSGFFPPTPGWRWCRTRGPLFHVDADGVGPVYLHTGPDGDPWVYSAARPGGAPVDIFELGFTEPLVSNNGVVDGEGEAGRKEADWFGPIVAPETPPPPFPRVN